MLFRESGISEEERLAALVIMWDTLPASFQSQLTPFTKFYHQMIEANKGWQAEDIKEMYKGCLPFSYMTRRCNHRGSNVTDSKLPQCTYEYNSCSQENGLVSRRRKRSEGESGECLTEANGWDYRGSVSETASGNYDKVDPFPVMHHRSHLTI